jgi:hypothetical protein
MNTVSDPQYSIILVGEMGHSSPFCLFIICHYLNQQPDLAQTESLPLYFRFDFLILAKFCLPKKQII